MNKKVLMFINYFGKTSETFISDEIRFLRMQENISLDILHYGPTLNDQNVFGVNLPSSFVTRWAKNPSKFKLGFLKSLKYRNGINASLGYFIKFFERRQYDVIYCHFGTNGKLVAQLKELGVISKDTRLVTRFHGLDMNLKKYSKDFYLILKRTDNVVLYGTSIAKQKLVEYGLDEQLLYLPVGIQNKHMIQQDFIEPQTREVNKLKILSVGRLIELKGHHLAISIVDQLRDENIELNIIGDGPMWDSLNKLVEEKSLAGKVKLLGSKSHDYVMSKLDECDVYLYSGIYDKEGRCENQATSVLEAMAKGKIVVCSSLGGIPDYLIDGKTGFLCEPGNVTCFAEKIRRVRANFSSIELSEIRRDAVKMVRANYSQSDLNEKLLSLLHGNINVNLAD